MADPKPDPAANPLSYQSLSNMLQPQPGWAYGQYLPIATKEVSPGQGAASAGWSFAMPTALRQFNQGVLDLLHGPATGQVTPEASFALTNMLLGGPRNQLIPDKLYSDQLGMRWPPGETRVPGTPYSPSLNWQGKTGLEVPRPPAPPADDVEMTPTRFYTHPNGQIEQVTRTPGVVFTPNGILSRVLRADGSVDYLPDAGLHPTPRPLIQPAGAADPIAGPRNLGTPFPPSNEP